MTRFLLARWHDLRLALILLTRIPIPPLRADGDGDALGRAVWAYPVVGALVGALGGGVLVASACLGIPDPVAVLLGLAATVVITGAFHEDGLADFCDGVGGGATPERRLEIMRDSRIGTYGALALVLSIALRAAALLALAPSWTTVAIWAAAGALGRASVALVLARLPPARSDGLGTVARSPPFPALAGAWIFAIALTAGLLSWPGLWLVPAAVASGLVIAGLARRFLKGYTGDALGASAQLGEISVLVVACAIWRAS